MVAVTFLNVFHSEMQQNNFDISTSNQFKNKKNHKTQVAWQPQTTSNVKGFN
jgi:pyruvate formate-lyase activating enzyme-like uncharacterized protein